MSEKVKHTFIEKIYLFYFARSTFFFQCFSSLHSIFDILIFSFLYRFFSTLFSYILTNRHLPFRPFASFRTHQPSLNYVWNYEKVKLHSKFTFCSLSLMMILNYRKITRTKATPWLLFSHRLNLRIWATGFQGISMFPDLNYTKKASNENQ